MKQNRNELINLNTFDFRGSDKRGYTVLRLQCCLTKVTTISLDGLVWSPDMNVDAYVMPQGYNNMFWSY